MKRKLCLIIAAIICLTLVGCRSRAASDEEIINAARRLIEKSAEVNMIYFGEGLPFDREGDNVKKICDTLDVTVDKLSYFPVTDDAPYHTVAELKSLAEAVYSTDYCNFLFSRTFEALHDEDDLTIMYARYLEQYGFLTVREDRGGMIIELDSVYDTDNIDVVRVTENYALISVNITRDGETTARDLKLVYELHDGLLSWRLDTPTY